MATPELQSAPAATPTEVAARLAALRARVDKAAAAAGRRGDEVTIVAVTKTHGPEVIRPALEAGHRCFGENRVPEALAKWPKLKAAYGDVELHLVGPLQSNKVRRAVALFDVIETLDRPKLARKLAAEIQRSGRRPACYIQVNTGEEPQKSGLPPAEADAFIAACRQQYGLPVRGLMCVPPLGEEPSPHFALLAGIAARHQLEVLSMGMSADFEVAVAFGASHVRVGTAIFGPRRA